MNVLYENPNKVEYNQLIDKNGKTFWLNWGSWIKSIKIVDSDSIKLLPKEIADLIPKWNDDIEKIKNRMKDEEKYPIKFVSIHFIYDDVVYKLSPNLFSNEYQTRYYFKAIHENIEIDLQEVGCIYTKYSDELD